MAMNLQQFLSCCIIGILIISADARKPEPPRIKCYNCEHCGVEYHQHQTLCSPDFYFCVYLEILAPKINDATTPTPDGESSATDKFDGPIIHRYCGDQMNCTNFNHVEGFLCSVCSADLCNDDFRGHQSIISASFTLLFLDVLLTTCMNY